MMAQASLPQCLFIGGQCITVSSFLQEGERLLPVEGTDVFVTSISYKVFGHDGFLRAITFPTSKDGYPMITLRRNGQYTQEPIHRVVGLAFTEAGEMPVPEGIIRTASIYTYYASLIFIFCKVGIRLSHTLLCLSTKTTIHWIGARLT